MEQIFKIQVYKRLGDLLVKRNIKNFDILVLIPKKYFKRLKLNFEYKKKYLYGSVLGKLNFNNYSIYLLSWKNINLLHHTLNKLFL